MRYGPADPGFGRDVLLFSNPDASTGGEAHTARARMTVRLSLDTIERALDLTPLQTCLREVRAENRRTPRTTSG